MCIAAFLNGDRAWCIPRSPCMVMLENQTEAPEKAMSVTSNIESCCCCIRVYRLSIRTCGKEVLRTSNSKVLHRTRHCPGSSGKSSGSRPFNIAGGGGVEHSPCTLQ